MRISNDLVVNEHLTRQSDIIQTNKLGQKIIVVGAGATGSFSILCLAKMGMTNITVYDDDVVSTVNLNSQFYRKSDVNSPKVEALQNLILDFTGETIFINNKRFNEELTEEEFKSIEGSYLICCADDMNARKFCLDMAIKYKASLYIDPRMGAEKYAQYAIHNPTEENTVSYSKSLYTNEEAEQVPCTAKSTIYTATGGSCLIVKTVKNVLMSESFPKNIQWDVKLSESPMMMFANKTLIKIDQNENQTEQN